MNKKSLQLTAAEDDEIIPFPVAGPQAFYVLRENPASRAMRVKLSGLGECFPIDEIRRNQWGHGDNQFAFLHVEGSYYPDFIEESGLYFFSIKLLEDYVKYQVYIKPEDEYKRVALVSEGRTRQEEYAIVMPEQIDCLAEGSVRYDKNHQLTYFEIDPEKTKDLHIFRIKDFPHLIMTAKLNRLDYAGYECVRIENYFDYAGERDNTCAERRNGNIFAAALKDYFDTAVANKEFLCHYHMQNLSQKFYPAIEAEIKEGLQNIFKSYTCQPSRAEQGLNSHILFVCHPDGRFAVEDTFDAYFGITSFESASAREVFVCAGNLPAALQQEGKKAAQELLHKAFMAACCVCERFPAVHHDRRFRIYMRDAASKRLIAPLMYDFKSAFQRDIEDAGELKKYDFNGQFMDEFNFIGKNLSGMSITGASLRGADLRDSDLNKTVFINCDLTGARLSSCRARGAVFSKCTLYKTDFACADLDGAEIISAGDLRHAVFRQANLSNAHISDTAIESVYCFGAIMSNAVIECSGIIFNNVFCLSDCRSAQFKGGIQENLLEYVDFRNADLSGAVFNVHFMKNVSFVKAKLNGTDLSCCAIIKQCNFSRSNCQSMIPGNTRVEFCDFTRADLSLISAKKGMKFSGNDFSFTNLSGYDFSEAGYCMPNHFIHANVSGCNLSGLDLSSSVLLRQE